MKDDYETYNPKIMSDKTSLGDRMKSYENITRQYLMPRSYVFLRIDGKSFHTYTKNLNKPFDKELSDDMNSTAIFLCENIQNVKIGYVQSDEITILLTDFDNINTQQFFGGNIQKISSVVASIATARFNQLRIQKFIKHKSINVDSLELELAIFDCRCWNIPSQIEAMNTFIWRNQDCIRNGVSMVAQHNFSHKELQGKSTPEMYDMLLHQKGVNWDNYTESNKYGRLIVKEEYEIKPPLCVLTSINGNTPVGETKRTHWVAKSAWKFTEDKDKLLEMMPKYE